MKTICNIILVLLILATGCKKEEKVRTSGTDTINNYTYTENSTYAVHGFSFSTGKVVSTEPGPGPEMLVYVNKDNPALPPRLYFLSNNLLPSFYKAGEYADENAARSAFDNLREISVPQWSDLADPVKPHQIWIYRSGRTNYTKIRIVSTVNEKRQNPGDNTEIDFGEVTFQWVHQPDGSLTFPE